jgi:BCD family chlorophyll transporter-like MFS transporter
VVTRHDQHVGAEGLDPRDSLVEFLDPLHLAYEGAVLADEFSPARLIQVIQACALSTLVLNTVAMWKQETLKPGGRAPDRRARSPEFREAWARYTASPGARRRLLAIGLGTMGFAMQDVLLEPYGGEVLGMSVGQTTWLTATLACGGLVGFGLAAALLVRGSDPTRLARMGVGLGVPAFALVIAAALWSSTALFVPGVCLIGLSGGLFGHATLTLTMNRAPRDQIGLALGAWGAVQATAAGVAVALGGLGKDLMGAWAARGSPDGLWSGPASGYAAVYMIEIVLLLAAWWVLRGGAAVTRSARATTPEHQVRMG